MRGIGWLTTVAGVVLMMGTQLPAQSVVNGDFETDTFTVWPGYIGGDNPATITGWTVTGQGGINPVAPEDDAANAPFSNGKTDSKVAFLQGPSSIEQIVSGFSPGSNYVLSMDYNSRGCCGDLPIAEVKLNGISAGTTEDIFGGDGSVPTVANDAWHTVDIEFTAPTEDITLAISAMPVNGGDATFVVDNVRFTPEPSSGLLLLLGLLGFASRRRR